MWRLPVIGHFPPFEWMTELFAWGGLIGILVLIVIRQRAHPRSAAGEKGRRSRFFGSTWWQAYYVEATILGVTLCILLLRTLEAALVSAVEPGGEHRAALPAHGVARRASGRACRSPGSRRSSSSSPRSRSSSRSRG